MFYSLRGTLVHTDGAAIAIECAGVAYLCQTSLSTMTQLAGIGEEVQVYTYMHIRQDAVDLFGFADMAELGCFKMLIGVTGVGPRVALNILSAMTPERLALCVASGDDKSITVAQGVGKKLAQRIVLELQDKVKNVNAAKAIGSPAVPLRVGSGPAAEAISALVVLGYSQADAAAAVSGLEPSLAVEEMIKAGLKILSGGKG